MITLGKKSKGLNNARKNHLEISLQSINKYVCDFGDEFRRDTRKINNLLTTISKLINPIFIFFSEDVLYYLLRNEQDYILTKRLLESAKEHYVLITNIRLLKLIPLHLLLKKKEKEDHLFI